VSAPKFCDLIQSRNVLTEFNASSRNPREMLLVNFVRKEAASAIFPINIKPTGWDQKQFLVKF
jgi:hypothetical protein